MKTLHCVITGYNLLEDFEYMRENRVPMIEHYRVFENDRDVNYFKSSKLMYQETEKIVKAFNSIRLHLMKRYLVREQDVSLLKLRFGDKVVFTAEYNMGRSMPYGGGHRLKS